MSDTNFEPFCLACKQAHGKLLSVQGTDDFIHEDCAQESDYYGVCRYCLFNREDVAYLLEDLTPEGECADHKGESASSGPDIDDIVENIINNS